MSELIEVGSDDILGNEVSCFAEGPIDSENIYIIFSGFGGIRGLFDFKKTIDGASNCRKIFLRDRKVRWFLAGISREINSYDKLIEFIKKELSKNKYKKRIFIGSSGGGFAALGAGFLCDATSVHALCPQTFVDLKTNKIYRDNRWIDRWRSMTKENLDGKYFNLKNFMPNEILNNFNIYYCAGCRLDGFHVANIANHTKGIMCREVSCPEHNVGLFLKNNGMLSDYLLETDKIVSHDESSIIKKFVSGGTQNNGNISCNNKL